MLGEFIFEKPHSKVIIVDSRERSWPKTRGISVIKNIELAKVIFWSRFTSIVIIFFTLLLTQNVHIAKTISTKTTLPI